jgi:hypothetical protein
MEIVGIVVTVQSLLADAASPVCDAPGYPSIRLLAQTTQDERGCLLLAQTTGPVRPE